MQKTRRRRRLKKPVKIGIFAILIGLALGGFYLSKVIEPAEIHGFFTLDKKMPETNPNILTYFLQAPADYKEIAPGRWTIKQRYEIGKNSECVSDCVGVCIDKELDYYKAYVQEWGTCRCKCRVLGTETTEISG